MIHPLCWLIGHKVTGGIVKNSFTAASGKVSDGWQYHCVRCSTTDEIPDCRSIYGRTVRVWLARRQNRRSFAAFYKACSR